ncbi:hypothetical protein [Sediminitomix flava]|uniref:Outer membrane beta-barrel porin/alpha-amylase n=1 Tax=Sediminitomix flava TaxID=379075 RepID=A0A315ZCN1_SEDFL|nr:hypothetical protein [Sediminitomix flava]PWJ42504.1 hypothetical protein BC781_10245 [Sediminitomix flava]
MIKFRSNSFFQICFITTLTFLFFQTEVFAQDDKTEAEKAALKKAQANNPLADVRALNLQNNYISRLYGLPDPSQANSFVVRAAMPTGRVLWRASFPFTSISNYNSSSVGDGITRSGFGEIDLFAAYLAVSKPDLTIGIGPSVLFPTASSDKLAPDEWQLGAAFVVFKVISAQLQTGGLIIWRTEVGDNNPNQDVNFLAVQPFTFLQLGQGNYIRGAPIWQFNLETNDFSVPLGIGAGKVVKMGKTVFNIFIEPQYTILHDGVGQPAFQIFSSINMQFYSN